MRDFHPGSFNFTRQDIRILGMTINSGPSLSGIEEPIYTDGGGRVVADFSGGNLASREENLYWRATQAAMDGGANAVNVILCDARHQPIGDRHSVPHSDGTPFSDGGLYTGGGVPVATSAQNKGLRSVVCRVNFTSPRPIMGGEWFSIQHSTWGHRAYNVISVLPVSSTIFDIEFRPPLRQAITIGTALDFDRPRCQMRMASQPSNMVENGRTGSASITFIEDMRKPA